MFYDDCENHEDLLLVDLYLIEKKSAQVSKRLRCPARAGCKEAGLEPLCYRCSLLIVMEKVEKMKKAAVKSPYNSPPQKQKATIIKSLESMISSPPAFAPQQHQGNVISPAEKLPRFRSASSVRSHPRTSGKAALRGTTAGTRAQQQSISQLPVITSTKSFEDEARGAREQQQILRATTASPAMQRNGDRSGLSTASSQTTELFPEAEKHNGNDTSFLPIGTDSATGDLIAQYHATTSNAATPTPLTGGDRVSTETIAHSLSSEHPSPGASKGVSKHRKRPISSPAAKAGSPVLRPIATPKDASRPITSASSGGQGRDRDRDRDQSRSVASPSRPSPAPARSPSPAFLMFDKLRPDSPFSIGRLSDASFRRYNEGTKQFFTIRF
jgi:hypothetical protein